MTDAVSFAVFCVSGPLFPRPGLVPGSGAADQATAAANLAALAAANPQHVFQLVALDAAGAIAA